MFELPSSTGHDVRTSVVRAMILHIVQREIFCPVTGSVLDIDTCVAVVHGPEMDDVAVVCSPEAWTQRGDAVRKAFPNAEIWTGRVQTSA